MSESLNLTEKSESPENKNRVRKIKQTEFDKGKNSLLRHYSDIQTSSVTRLIGFVAGLFTLIQTVQTSKIYKISDVFVIPISIPIPDYILAMTPLLRLLLFAGAVFVLVFYIVRTMFRFAAFNDLKESLLALSLSSLPEEPSADTSIEEIIATNVLTYLRGRKAQAKVYGIPVTWFIRSDLLKKENTCGLKFAISLSAFLTALFIGILW